MDDTHLTLDQTGFSDALSPLDESVDDKVVQLDDTHLTLDQTGFSEPLLDETVDDEEFQGKFCLVFVSN